MSAVEENGRVEHWRLACPLGHQSLVHRRRAEHYACQACKQASDREQYKYEAVTDTKTEETVYA